MNGYSPTRSCPFTRSLRRCKKVVANAHIFHSATGLVAGRYKAAAV